MKLLLQDKELWQKFNEHQTEMMITNSGRYVRCLSRFIWLFPPLCSSHQKRHQSILLASLNFLCRCFTKSLTYAQPITRSRGLTYFPLRLVTLVFCLGDQSAKRIMTLLASLWQALASAWNWNNRTVIRLEWRRKVANFILDRFIL